MKNIINSFHTNRLKKYRRLMGYSQFEVMFMLGFQSTSRISRWENGETIPSVKNLLKLSILYKTLPNELFYELVQELRVEIEEKWKIIRENKK